MPITIKLRIYAYIFKKIIYIRGYVICLPIAIYSILQYKDTYIV